MYSDVQELYDGGATHLEEELRCAAARAAAAKSQATSGSNNAVPQQVRQGSSNSSMISGSTLMPQSSSSPTHDAISTQTASTTPPTGIEMARPLPAQFLLLCVNGPRLAEMRPVRVYPGMDDQVLFQDIRTAYTEVRKSYYARSFHPDTPRILQSLAAWSDQFWLTAQKLITKLFKKLRLGWLVWWLEDDVFYIPRSGNFVRVSTTTHF